MRKQVIVIAALLTVQAASAQDFMKTGFLRAARPERSESVMTFLIKVASAAPKYDKSADGHEFDLSITGIRGGNGSKRPLGQYLVDPDMEFRSEYKNQATETMCQFAYDLHEFVAANGGDFESMTANQKSTFVPYQKQEQFAISWWTRHYPKYTKLGGLWKDWFIHDAIVDATNLYNWAMREQKMCQSYGSWENSALLSVMKRKP